MVTKRTVDELVKLYLEDIGFDANEQKDLLKNFNKEIKTAKKKKDTVVDHGTTCIRIRTNDAENILCDL